MAVVEIPMESAVTGVYRKNLHVPKSLHLAPREYAATLEQRDGYRYVRLTPVPRIKIVGRFLGNLVSFPQHANSDLELALQNDSIRLPQPILDYLGMMPHDRAAILVSQKEGIRVWDLEELMRYFDSMNSESLSKFDRELHGMLSQRYNNPQAQSGRHSQGF